ncbi:MAG: hypothetical protein LQ351_006933 [Letrouitia transgressa]|nr:MAG: hypothetical protein LQ351_006933 [Letrouitia transgressa]
MGLGNRGSSEITGRGLLAIAGRGSISQIKLEVNENYVVHPRLQPYFRSTVAIQAPNFFISTAGSGPWIVHFTRSNRAFPDRARIIYLAINGTLPVQFTNLVKETYLGRSRPVTILLQTRGGKSTDILTTRDINDIADTPAGALETRLPSTLGSSITTNSKLEPSTPQSDKKNTPLNFANVDRSGKVSFEKSEKSENSGAAVDQRAQT